MSPFILAILFIFGLAIASFLNVVSLRYDPEKPLFKKDSLQGRSRCMKCLQTLRWFELIPLFSFLALRARCRSCKDKISWQYPIVELLGGVIAAGIPWILFRHYDLQFALLPLAKMLPYYFTMVLWTLLGFVLLLIAIIDASTSIIPDEANVAIAGLGITIVTIENYFPRRPFTFSFLGPQAAIFGFESPLWITVLLGVGAGVVVFGALAFFSRGRAMGWGDVKLGAAAGIAFRWPDMLVISFLSFVLGALFVLPGLILRRHSMKQAVPFGPFIVLALFVILFFGECLIKGYFSLFPVY